jgi:hypothetical protein
VGTGRIKGRALPGEALRPGRPAWFGIPRGKTHRFDRATGARIAG